MVEIVGAFHTHPLSSTSALGRDQKPKLCGELNTALPLLDARREWRNVAQVKCTRPVSHSPRGRKRREVGDTRQEHLGTLGPAAVQATPASLSPNRKKEQDPQSKEKRGGQ